jgi:hypothetical protein
MGQDSRLSVKMTVELLEESVSLPLMNENLAWVDRQTYKEAQNDLNYDSVISEENTLTVKMFKRNLQRNY